MLYSLFYNGGAMLAGSLSGGPVATFAVGTAVFSYNIYKYLTCDPNPSHPVVSDYAKYLKNWYSTNTLAQSKFPPTSGKVFIKLALVKKQRLSQAQADELIRRKIEGNIDQIFEDKEPIEMDDILKTDDKVRLVVVEGAPGIGKSTLAWELCRQWPKLESLKQFSLVVFLSLREETVQIAKDISDLFYYPVGNSSLVAQKVIKDKGNGVLFVFDGFDEFPSEFQKKSLVMDIIRGSKYLPKATVLVTSRTSESAQLQALLQTSIDRHIEVMGFSERGISKFAESVFRDTNLFNDFQAYLKANPVLKGMMYNPLNSRIVVGVYNDTYESGKPVPHTQTQLYTKLTWCLLLRYLREIQHPMASKLPDNLKDLRHDSDLYQQLLKVGKLAFEAKLREQVIFTQLPEGFSDLGLLVKHTALYEEEESTTYNFFHLTLQEYMSAFYISQLPGDEQRTLFSERSTSMDVVWRFVAGLTKMRNIGWDKVMGTKGKELQVQNKQMRGVVINNDKLVNVGPFVIQCLYEAQDRQSFESVFGQHVVQFNSQHHDLSNYGLYALGYCISLCSNTWIVNTWSIPKESLEALDHGMKVVNYGGGSIKTLDLFGSRGIMNERKRLLPDNILQQIEKLILMSCYIDKRGFENLAEHIPYLNSLTLLDISGNPGGNGSLVKLLVALKKHRKLQTLRMKKVAIGKGDVAALAGLVRPSSNLRELAVGGLYLAADVANQLVRTVLSPSSLDTVLIYGCEYPLDRIETISSSISSLTFENPFRARDTSLMVKSGTKLSDILRENTSLKELKLHIPLDENEVKHIIASLRDNHSLERLELSGRYHSQYFSESEKETMDSRISLANPYIR